MPAWPLRAQFTLTLGLCSFGKGSRPFGGQKVRQPGFTSQRVCFRALCLPRRPGFKGLSSHMGSCDEKDLGACGLMFCYHHIESLYNFLTMALHFHFSLGPADSGIWSFPLHLCNLIYKSRTTPSGKTMEGLNGTIYAKPPP